MTALSIFPSRESFPQPGRLSLRQTYVSNLRSSAPLLSVFNVFEEVRVQTSHWDTLITGEVVWPRQTGGEVGLGGREAELVLKWSPPGMPPAQSEWPTGERTWYKKEWRDQAAFIQSDLIKKKKPGTLFAKPRESLSLRSHHGTTVKLLDVWMFPCPITDRDLEPCPEKVRNVCLHVHACSAWSSVAVRATADDTLKQSSDRKQQNKQEQGNKCVLLAHYKS